MRATGVTVLAAALLATLSACESSQQTSARLKREGVNIIGKQRGLVISARSRDVRVLRTALTSDQNGTAVVVVLHNLKPIPLLRVPIAIDVLGAGGKSVFRNSEAGLAATLTSVASIPARGVLAWVNDHVTPSGRALTVHAEVGASGSGAPPKLPEIDLSTPRLVTEPGTGLQAIGRVSNRSTITQLRLFIYCIARRAGRIVGAGSGAIDRLKAGAHATYHIFLIGDTRGAQLTATAPPTILR